MRWKTQLDEVIGHNWTKEACPPGFSGARLGQYLTQESDPNAQHDDISCLPHWVARYGTSEQLDALIAAGGDINCRGPLGHTPLLYVYKELSLRTIIDETRIHMLLERGAEIRASDNKGKTALHYLTGSLCGRTAEVEFLIRNGAIVDARDKEGRQAIHGVAMMCQPQTACKLVELGAKINAKDRRGQTPLHVVGEWIGSWGWSEERVMETAVRLINLGADPNIQDRSGGTVLTQYVRRFHQYPRLAQALLVRGADSTIADKDDLLPRHIALVYGNRKIARMMAP